PSGGMMFAVGIYDLLTPGDLTGGAHIAGTGTIDSTGAIGPIGGIQEKMYGASAAGAKYFLAPASNCNEVVGHVPAGMQLFKISTYDQAVAVVKAIGEKADLSGFATCTK
ncbi:MAG: S16 family serine protease, partial [Rhodoluna sp.]